jgi:hypothetical protein
MKSTARLHLGDAVRVELKHGCTWRSSPEAVRRVNAVGHGRSGYLHLGRVFTREPSRVRERIRSACDDFR